MNCVYCMRFCRYTKQADWQYIKATSEACPGLQLIGNGDVLSQQEYYERLASCPQMATAMIARAALIKPWIFTEVALLHHPFTASKQEESELEEFPRLCESIPTTS